MSDYIKKEDVINVLAVVLCAESRLAGYDVSAVDCVPEAAAWVNDYCPSIYREPNVGSWEVRPAPPDDHALGRKRYYCSACGNWNSYGKSDFCPKCGADMRGEKTDIMSEVAWERLQTDEPTIDCPGK